MLEEHQVRISVAVAKGTTKYQVSLTAGLPVIYAETDGLKHYETEYTFKCSPRKLKLKLYRILKKTQKRYDKVTRFGELARHYTRKVNLTHEVTKDTGLLL